MRHLAEYKELAEFVDELGTEAKKKPLEPVPGRFYQQQYRVADAAGELSAKVVLRGRTPTCLRVSNDFDSHRRSRLVTKLDLNVGYSGEVETTAHLSVSTHPGGLHIATIRDIPPDSQTQLDMGLALLFD